MNGQCLAKYHFVKRLRHTSEHDFMSTHQTSVQKFINQRVLSPLAPQNKLTDGVDKKLSDFVPQVRLILVLQKGVGVGVESVFVGGLVG